MKIKCEICGSPGHLQHLSKNYYRVKHYKGSIDGKLKFEYHKQSFQYVQSIFNTNKSGGIDPIDPRTIDLNLNNNRSFNEKEGGRRLAWFRIPAWGVGDPGFKSQRPHQPHFCPIFAKISTS